MLANYFKIAVKVLLRRKFYTAVSLFGIAFTLLVLLLCTALLDEVFSANYPETRLDRILSINRAEVRGARYFIRSSPGFALLDRYGRDLPGVEKFSIISVPHTAASFVEACQITTPTL